MKRILLGLCLLHIAVTIPGRPVSEEGRAKRKALEDLHELFKACNGQCPECPERFTTASSFLQHHRKHTPRPRHTCDTCKLSYYNEKLLAQHKAGDPRRDSCKANKKRSKVSNQNPQKQPQADASELEARRFLSWLALVAAAQEIATNEQQSLTGS